jgi:hypothetical protein
VSYSMSTVSVLPRGDLLGSQGARFQWVRLFWGDAVRGISRGAWPGVWFARVGACLKGSFSCNWSGASDRVRDYAAAGIQGRPSVSMMRASKKCGPCLAAVDR